MWLKVLGLCVGLQLGFWLLGSGFDEDAVQGQRVVITGASTGIGEQIAYHYARLGASILITARRQHVLEKVVAKCRELGSKDGKYEYIAADMSDLSVTKNVIEEAKRRLGGIDVLVLNHIIVLPLGEWTGSEKNFTGLDLTFDTNFKAYVHLTSHALPELERTRGRVVVVSSLTGRIGTPFVAPYSASKFALEGFFSSFRQEQRMKNTGISVTICIIGFIGTENAVSRVMGFGQEFLLSVIKPASPSDTALAILQGATLRNREVYFPYMDVRIPTLIRDWVPEMIDSLMRYITEPVHYSSRG